MKDKTRVPLECPICQARIWAEPDRVLGKPGCLAVPRPRRDVHAFKSMPCPCCRRGQLVMAVKQDPHKRFESALKEVRSAGFAEKAWDVLEDREVDFLANDPAVHELARAFADVAPGKARIEPVIDELFESLSPAQPFENTGAVMAILFALKQAEPGYFEEIANTLAESKAPEISTLRHVARALLHDREMEILS